MRLIALACALVLASSVVACGGGNPAPKTSFDSTATQQLAFGVQMARRQLWNEALFRFRQASKMEPNNPRIVNNLAVACEATGQFDEALAYYKDALKLSPTDRTVKGNYTRFVEFYQSLKPQEGEEDDENSGDGDAEDGDAEDGDAEDGGSALSP